MAVGMKNLRNATWAAGKGSEPKPGDVCVMCGQPAPYRVAGSGRWKPACQVHAEGAAKLGYSVNPQVAASTEQE